MKKTLGALFALGIFAALSAGAQAATVKPAPATDAASGIVKVQYDGYHGRWSSHQRYGSGSGGHSYGHYRWRSHQRYGSGGSGGSGGFGYGEGGGDGHSRHQSHRRYGSGGFGSGEREHRRSHSHRRYGSESGFGY